MWPWGWETRPESGGPQTPVLGSRLRPALPKAPLCALLQKPETGSGERLLSNCSAH